MGRREGEVDGRRRFGGCGGVHCDERKRVRAENWRRVGGLASINGRWWCLVMVVAEKREICSGGGTRERF